VENTVVAHARDAVQGPHVVILSLHNSGPRLERVGIANFVGTSRILHKAFAVADHGIRVRPSVLMLYSREKVP